MNSCCTAAIKIISIRRKSIIARQTTLNLMWSNALGFKALMLMSLRSSVKGFAIDLNYHHCQVMPLKMKGINIVRASVINLALCHWLKLSLKKLKLWKSCAMCFTQEWSTGHKAFVKKKLFVLLISMIMMPWCLHAVQIIWMT